ncbi:MAG: TlpA disulfide reductase family protein [Rubrimonas sp.]
MRSLACLTACLYAAALLGATPAAAWGPDAQAAVQAARTGEMEKLIVHDAPRDRLSTPFADGDGVERVIADWEGQVVLVNFWATWCPPCLKEMPALDRLAAERNSDDFAVLTISTDRGDLEKPRRWFAENGIENLPLLHDGRLRLAQEAALLGQPTTLLLDRQGREIARFQGDAEWDSDEAWAVIEAVIAQAE